MISIQESQIVNIISEGFSRVRLSARQYQPFVSLVMTTVNRGVDILPVVRSVLALDYPSFELIVIDQNHRRDTFLALFPLLDSPNLHYYRLLEKNVARQWNFAVRISRATLVGIIDDQTMLVGDWLSKAVTQLRAHPQAAMLLDAEGPADKLPSSYQTVSTFARAEVVGHKLLLRRRAFYDIGGFDELVGEQLAAWPAMVTDVAVRAILKGYEVNVAYLPAPTRDGDSAVTPDPARWYDFGVICAKPVKAGVFAGLPLTFHYLFGRALRARNRGWPAQLTNFRAFVRGFLSGLDLPLRSDSLCFQPPQKVASAEQLEAMVWQSPHR